MCLHMYMYITREAWAWASCTCTRTLHIQNPQCVELVNFMCMHKEYVHVHVYMHECVLYIHEVPWNAVCMCEFSCTGIAIRNTTFTVF